MNIFIPEESRSRHLQSLPMVTATLEGTAYFWSKSVPSEDEMTQVTKNAFKADDEIVMFINILKSSQDIVLASVQNVSGDLVDKKGNLNNSQFDGQGTSWIPIVAGGVSSLAFLVGAIILAKKYKIFSKSDNQ